MRKIAEQKRKRKIRSFAKDRAICWTRLEDFVNRRCKPKKDRDNFLDELTAIIDGYIGLNLRMYNWCFKNGVDLADFLCDVCNREGINLRKQGDKNGKES